jgi:hypothetical protein
MKDDLINKISKLIAKLKKDNIQAKLLIMIIEMLKRLKSEYSINRYDVINEFVAIEIIDKNLIHYINIEVTNSNIEFRGDSFEMVYFFDNPSFALDYKDIIMSFFEGKYNVISYFSKKLKKEAFGVVWDNRELSEYDNLKEAVRFIRSKVIREFKERGLKLID